jgi:hypothetical protein
MEVLLIAKPATFFKPARVILPPDGALWSTPGAKHGMTYDMVLRRVHIQPIANCGWVWFGFTIGSIQWPSGLVLGQFQATSNPIGNDWQEVFPLTFWNTTDDISIHAMNLGDTDCDFVLRFELLRASDLSELKVVG